MATKQKIENVRFYSLEVNKSHCQFTIDVLKAAEQSDRNIDAQIAQIEVSLYKEIGN